MFRSLKTNFASSTTMQINSLSKASVKTRPYSSSFVLAPLKTPNNVFRGCLTDYLKTHKKLENIDSIILTGKQVRPGIFNSSVACKPSEFAEFCEIIDEMKIKDLALDGCRLSPEIGCVIGDALQTNKTLEGLLVTPNELMQKGMIAILRGLKNNSSLKKLICASYNVECHDWFARDLRELQELIYANSSLQFIDLPNNQINEPADLRILIKPYEEIKNRELATISGFEISRDRILDVNSLNVLNGSLEKFARIRFSNR